MANCKHQKLYPLEIAFAKVTYPNGYKEPPEYDYAVSMFNANVAHVKRLYCPTCDKIIKAPNVYDFNEKENKK